MPTTKKNKTVQLYLHRSFNGPDCLKVFNKSKSLIPEQAFEQEETIRRDQARMGRALLLGRGEGGGQKEETNRLVH